MSAEHPGKVLFARGLARELWVHDGLRKLRFSFSLIVVIQIPGLFLSPVSSDRGLNTNFRVRLYPDFALTAFVALGPRNKITELARKRRDTAAVQIWSWCTQHLSFVHNRCPAMDVRFFCLGAKWRNAVKRE